MASKYAGYDALILKGRCNGRKWLEINEEQFTFHDAGDLWGTKVSQCQEQLVQLTGRKSSASCASVPRVKIW